VRQIKDRKRIKGNKILDNDHPHPPKNIMKATDRQLITDFTLWLTDNYTYMDADMLINRRDAQDYFKGKKVKQYTREQVIKLYKPKKK